MPRRSRLVAPGYPHHVTQRGNRRQKTFFSPDDYRFYKDLLCQQLDRHRVDVWAYCLMPNHVHLILEPQTPDGLANALRVAHSKYARRINDANDWRGHLWQERFYSCVMDESHLVAAARYVELNPVRAGLCASAELWPWSSTRAHLLGRQDPLVSSRKLLELVSDWGEFLSESDSNEMHNDIRRHSASGWPLGSKAFVEKLESRTGLSLMPGKAGRPPKK